MKYLFCGLGSIGQRHLENLRKIDKNAEILAYRSSKKNVKQLEVERLFAPHGAVVVENRNPVGGPDVFRALPVADLMDEGNNSGFGRPRPPRRQRFRRPERRREENDDQDGLDGGS